MAPKFIHAMSVTLLFFFFIFLTTVQPASVSKTTLSTQTCSYPCLPPPIPTTNCPPSPLAPPPPSPQLPPVTPLPPGWELPPPSPDVGFWAAPPPPNPILPYFPWYYMYPPPPTEYSMALSLQQPMVMVPRIIFIALFSLLC